MAFAICASQDANRLSIQYASDNLRLGLRPGVERNLMSFLFLPLWRYANFSGRASRREFWSFFALSAAVFIAVLILTGLSGEPSTPNRPGEAPPYWIVAYVVWWLATLLPWLAVQVRRFHDQGRTGWLVAVNVGGYLSFPVAPWLGLILIVLSMLLMALPGELGANQYGDSLIDDANADGEENLANQTSLTEAQPKVGASPHKPEVTRYSGRREGGTAIEPGIKLGQDGRFYVHGDAHESLQEAQLAIPIAKHVDPCVPEDPRFEVKQTPDGRYSCAGYSFSTREQAHRYSQQRRNRFGGLQSAVRSTESETEISAVKSAPAPISAIRPGQLRPEPTTNSDSSGDGSKSDPGKKFVEETLLQAGASVSESPGEHMSAPEDPRFAVRQTSDGRYSCAGYSFSTYEQAQSYSIRRQARFATSPPRTGSILTPRPVAAPARQVTTPASPVRSRQSMSGGGVSASSAAVRWIASPTKITVGDIEFNAELLYVGARTREQRHSPHRALVDPALPIARYADKAGSTLDYWPNYAELQPQARRAYLEWLAAGRRDPTTPVGYVFIFFYGLERRLIAEKSKADAPAILHELGELLAVYGYNHSFQRYCKALIEAAEVILEMTPTTPKATPDLRLGWEIPISVRVHLGKKVRDGSPIDAEDALCWTLSHPQLSTKTAVTRCFDEFHALWHYRFRERFPGGIKVRQPKARIQFNYRAASSEFYANATIDDLPDIGAISGPISKFDALLSSCSEELDPLSRFLGRRPEERKSVLAAALCPAPVRDQNSESGFAKARAALVAAIESGGFGQLAVAAVLDTLLQGSAAVDAEARKTYLKRLADILDAMRIGFEPDKRFGPPVPLADGTMLCLFEMRGDTQPIESRANYHSARTMVEVAVLAARADEVVVQAELQSIVTDLATVAGLSDVDQQRLHAHTLALVANPPKLRASTKRLLELPDCEKQLVLTSVVNAIVADQRVTPAEVRFLEGLYKALGMPQDEVYTRLHAGASAVVPQPERSASGQPRNQTGAIDSDRLARIRQETSAVSTMLASIFREEEPEAVAAAVANPATVKHAFPGLDAAHTFILLRLTAEPFEADAFEALCRENRLLPGGAIETINDWAFDTLDDVAVEDDDVICIQPHLIEAIKQMSVAA